MNIQEQLIDFNKFIDEHETKIVASRCNINTTFEEAQVSEILEWVRDRVDRLAVLRQKIRNENDPYDPNVQEYRHIKTELKILQKGIAEQISNFP
jgi:hypothetical protein